LLGEDGCDLDEQAAKSLPGSVLIQAVCSFGAWPKTSAVTAIASQQACLHPWLFTSREVSETETSRELDGLGMLGNLSPRAAAHVLLDLTAGHWGTLYASSVP